MDELTQATEVSQEAIDAAWNDEEYVPETSTEETEESETEETTSETDTADQQEQGEEEADTDEAEQEQEKETDQFTLKVLGEEKTVSREEIIPLAQKGVDYDRVRAKLDEAENAKAETDKKLAVFGEIAKQQGFKNLDELIDETRATMLVKSEGIDIDIARQKVALQRKEQELLDKEAALTAKGKESTEAETKAAEKEQKRQNEILAFVKEFPDVQPKDIPKEVWDKVNGGTSLTEAYTRFENAKLKAELAAKKKAAENKSRSTGSRHSTGNGAEMDEYEKAWREA